MTIRVRPESPVPIYEQIIGQIVFAVAASDLAPGEMVPSVRDLAAELVVNPNTVVRAYQELERAGILESKRGLAWKLPPRGRSVAANDGVRSSCSGCARLCARRRRRGCRQSTFAKWSKTNGRG